MNPVAHTTYGVNCESDFSCEQRKITVGICTFRRSSLFQTLESIAEQYEVGNTFVKVVVSDNDEVASLGDDLAEFARGKALDLVYVHAPSRNISIARNACLEHAEGEFLVFIDDDEIAEPDWLRTIVAAADESGAGVVFGPAHAVYPPDAPRWMVENDFHSNIPTPTRGVVETGFSSNVLLDLRNPAVRGMRFSLAYGKTGGEDIDFFFRLHRRDVPMTICLEAAVSEPVEKKRMSGGWVLRRRYRSGQIYGHCAMSSGTSAGLGPRLDLMARSLAKGLYSAVRAILPPWGRSQAIFWIMRASFHAGVVTGVFSRPKSAFYGVETATR